MLRIVLITFALLPATSIAQTDEIQVHDAEFAAPGVFNLTWHNNFTPMGIKTPSSPGGVTSDRSLNGIPEWALRCDSTTKDGLEIEFGAGVGLTNAADKFTLKLILAKDLNKKK